MVGRCVKCESKENVTPWRYSRARSKGTKHIKRWLEHGDFPVCLTCRLNFERWELDDPLKKSITILLIFIFGCVGVFGLWASIYSNEFFLFIIGIITLIPAVIFFVYLGIQMLLHYTSENNPAKYIAIRGSGKYKKFYVRSKSFRGWVPYNNWVYKVEQTQD